MIDFLWGLAGGIVGVIPVSIVLNAVLEAITDPKEVRPSRGDKVIGVIIGVLAVVMFSGTIRLLVGDPSPFVEKLGMGAGIAVVLVADKFVALRRGHRRAPEHSAASPIPPGSSGWPAAFSGAVHAHFAEPTARARYVIAAYRRGLIPEEYVPGLAAELAPLLTDGAPAWAALAEHEQGELDDIVDRAAEAIGYAPTADEAYADVVERLIYTAMCSTDPMIRLATVELLTPPVRGGESDLAEWDVPFRIESRRAAVRGALETQYDGLLTPGVARHFRDPTVRAGDLIAGYRRGVIFSADVPQAAAEIVAELPGAGEAWTELAMASGAEPRSELLPILDRAADEIAYSRTDEEAEEDLLESAAYRVLVTGEVMDESERLLRLDDHGYVIEYDHRFDQAPELEALRDARRHICGDYYFEQIASVRISLAAYLTARYP